VTLTARTRDAAQRDPPSSARRTRSRLSVCFVSAAARSGAELSGDSAAQTTVTRAFQTVRYVVDIEALLI